MATPLLIVGDAPFTKTGLSRILTDLAVRVSQMRIGGTSGPELGPSRVPFDVGVVGYHLWADLPRTGIPLQRSGDGLLHHWREWAFSNLQSWGADAVSTAYRAWFGDRKGILLSIWDPGRCHAFTEIDLPVERWGYFAIDAANMNGGISGPAGLAVSRYDRVLAYTEFGKRVLETATDLPVEVLPHGIDLSIFTREMTAGEREAGIRRLFPAGYREGTLVLGCVATNQPRKDLGLFVRVLRLLRERGHNIHGWLHTDRLISEAWSIPQLAADAQLEEALTVTTEATDRDLAVLYSLCVATVAPGRGEGFGYPIVESSACGVPVIHAAHGGGEEFTPLDCMIKPLCLHAEGPYALLRPILPVDQVAWKIETLISDPYDPVVLRQRVNWLDWPTLWPSWAAWFGRGLAEFEEKEARR